MTKFFRVDNHARQDVDFETETLIVSIRFENLGAGYAKPYVVYLDHSLILSTDVLNHAIDVANLVASGFDKAGFERKVW